MVAAMPQRILVVGAFHTVAKNFLELALSSGEPFPEKIYCAETKTNFERLERMMEGIYHILDPSDEKKAHRYRCSRLICENDQTEWGNLRSHVGNGTIEGLLFATEIKNMEKAEAYMGDFMREMEFKFTDKTRVAMVTWSGIPRGFLRPRGLKSAQMFQHFNFRTGDEMYTAMDVLAFMKS